MWGEVKQPHYSIDCINLHILSVTEPFPFVPAICMNYRSFYGFPSNYVILIMFVNVALSFLNTDTLLSFYNAF